MSDEIEDDEALGEEVPTVMAEANESGLQNESAEPGFLLWRKPAATTQWSVVAAGAEGDCLARARALADEPAHLHDLFKVTPKGVDSRDVLEHGAELICKKREKSVTT